LAVSVGLLLFICSVLFELILSAQVKEVRRVLILYESSPSSPLENLVDRGMQTSLDNSPYQIEFYREYMETASFPDPADQKRFRDFYIRKYRNRRPDVIVAVGPSPLKFTFEAHKKSFPGVPVIFCLPNRLPGDVTLDSDFTGVQGDIAPAATLRAALRLRPGTKHVVVVSGTSPFDRQQVVTVKNQITIYQGALDISYLTDLPMSDLLQRLRGLPPRTIVMLAAFGRDTAGTRFTSTESGQMLVAAANAPVFVLNDRFLNHGEVGGDVSNAVEQGRIVGGMVLRVLDGEKPVQIPPVKTATSYIFDSQALKRWGLDEKNLPAGSIVLNRQPTVWELYQWYIISGIVVMVLEALLIFGLLWQRVRRKNAETKLAITYDRLRMALEAGRFVGWDADLKTGENRWFGDLKGMFGIPSLTTSTRIGEFQRRVHPEDVDRVTKAIEDARQTQQPYVAEFRIPQKDGNVRWAVARGQFYYASNGNPERMLGMAVDITERKLAEEALATVGGRLIQAQEQERVRIARELHDDINQRLALFQVELAGLAQSHSVSLTGFHEALEGLRRRMSDVSSDIHAISHRLHPSKLEYLGLVPASRSFCKEVAEHHKVKIDFEADGVPQATPQHISLTLFRVLQESLQNAIRHSGTKDFRVRFSGTDKEIQLIVRDRGKGFDIDAARIAPGLGLISMRERIGLVKGAILITSKPGWGTEINVCIPMEGASDAGRIASTAA
jgi:signal transduction histidine kinase